MEEERKLMERQIELERLKVEREAEEEKIMMK
jgi:hypothetical protein